MFSQMTNLNHSPEMAREKHSTMLEENQLHTRISYWRRITIGPEQRTKTKML